MKRLFLIIASIACDFTAQAWTKVVNGASHLIARKYMTQQAIAEYDRIASLKVEYKWTPIKNDKVALDANLQAVAADEKDILVRIEKALTVLRNRNNHSELEQYGALVTLQNLVPNFHNIARIGIVCIEITVSERLCVARARFRVGRGCGKIGNL